MSYRRLVELVRWRQAVQFLSVFGGIFTPGALCHDPQSRDRIAKSRYLIVEVIPVSLLDHIVRRLLHGVLEVVVIVIIVNLGRRLAFPAIGLGRPGTIRRRAAAALVV